MRIYGFLIARSVETGSNPVTDSHCLPRVISKEEALPKSLIVHKHEHEKQSQKPQASY